MAEPRSGSAVLSVAGYSVVFYVAANPIAELICHWQLRRWPP